MRYSKSFIYTQKKVSDQIDKVSHELCLRAGLTQSISSGLYTILPLGQRVINNLERIIKEELNAAGAQEVSMPIAQPAELWQESSRWDVYGKEMLRFKSREDRDFCLGPTHEEIICQVVKPRLHSYKQLPYTLYQIGRKFRDEMRPQNGLLRTKEFTMKDAYSFDTSEETLDKSYNTMRETYLKIFKRIGLDVTAVVADSGEIGGSLSEEFIVDGTDIEVAHIFKLGDKYSKAMNLTYSDTESSLKHPLMGCYGIGISRILAAYIEQHHDAKGILWDINLAPFKLVIIPIGNSAKVNERAYRIYSELSKKLDVLYDDRDVSTGIKFKDADLLGIPLKLIVSNKHLDNNEVELERRADGEKYITDIDQALRVLPVELKV
jgi:prolyl-tRNA synthetase